LLEENEHISIKALHTFNVSGNHIQEKVFLISLSQNKMSNKENSYDVVNVEFKIFRLENWNFFYIPWHEFVEDLWITLGVSLNSDNLRLIYSKSDINILYNEYFFSFLFMLILNIIGFFLFTLVIYPRSPFIALILLIFNPLHFYSTILPSYRKSQKFRKLSEIYI